MRVALVTESFLPDVNGVANSCRRVVEHLGHRGHDVLAVAPGRGPTSYAGAEVVRAAVAALPLCRGVGVGEPTARLEPVLCRFRPDVVHLALPVALGAHAASLTRRLGVPAPGVYQTDLARFAQQYRLGPAVPMIQRWVARGHRMVDLTHAPSHSAVAELRALRVPNVRRWGRGVDRARFNPSRRSECLRRRQLGLLWPPSSGSRRSAGTSRSCVDATTCDGAWRRTPASRSWRVAGPSLATSCSRTTAW